MGLISQTSEDLPPITSPYGNTLPLTDARGNLLADATRIIHAFMLFPDDPITAWSYVEVLSLMTVGRELYDFDGHDPRVAKFIAGSVKKSLNQLKVALMIGQTLLLGGLESLPMSQRRAIHVVQKIIDSRPHLQHLPRDEKNLREAFHRFEPSIHLLLAMISLNKDTWNMIELDDEALRSFLSAAVFLQGIFSVKSGVKDWKPWIVDPRFAISSHSLKLVGLSEAAISFAENYKANPDRI